MQKYICILEERYFLMLETYDRVVEELESMKKPLKSWQTPQRQNNPDKSIKAGYSLIIRFIRQKIKEDLR